MSVGAGCLTAVLLCCADLGVAGEQGFHGLACDREDIKDSMCIHLMLQMTKTCARRDVHMHQQQPCAWQE